MMMLALEDEIDEFDDDAPAPPVATCRDELINRCCLTHHITAPRRGSASVI